MEDASNIASRDRRGAARAATRRKVLFAALDNAQPHRSGVAVDISVNGLGVRTREPEPVGTQVEVELAPKPGNPASRTTRIKGRVVHVTALDDGSFSLGVRTQVHRPRRAVSPSLATSPLRTPASASVKAPAPPYAERPTASRNRVAPRALLALLFLLLLFLLPAGVKMERALDWSAHAGVPVSTLTTPAPVAPLALSEIEPFRTVLDKGQVLLAAGQPEEAARVLRDALAYVREGATGRFVARLNYAQSMAALGETTLALGVVRQALKDAAAVPETWVAAALELEAAVLVSGDAPVQTAGFDHALPLDTAKPFTAEGGLHIVIEQSQYLLTVYRGDHPLRAFPVGLGRDGATPLGTFRIANKIPRPDWYNNGEVVPAGDPNNPLGDSWMGLGGDKGATSYGIHPTTDDDSIGRDVSRGCIRMRPDDAETLFRLCPLDTPVRICDSHVRLPDRSRAQLPNSGLTATTASGSEIFVRDLNTTSTQDARMSRTTLLMSGRDEIAAPLQQH